MRDRNEWFKEAKGALRHLEIEAVENPFAWPTVTCVADGEDVLHALGLHPSRDVGGIVNVDESEVLELAELISPEPVTGSTSDGYHTFDELYHHRAVLFSVIVATFPGRSWKSLHHHDGTMYDGMFIVGIDTPAGPATYHYDVVCPECKRTFELEITTVRTYRTKRRIEDMPDGWTGEKSSLYICGESMDRLCDRLVGDGE